MWLSRIQDTLSTAPFLKIHYLNQRRKDPIVEKLDNLVGKGPLVKSSVSRELHSRTIAQLLKFKLPTILFQGIVFPWIRSQSYNFYPTNQMQMQ